MPEGDADLEEGFDGDEFDEEWDESWDDVEIGEGFDFIEIAKSALILLIRFRLPLIAILFVGILIGSATVVIPMIFEKEEAIGPQSHFWRFDVERVIGGAEHSVFVEDGTTEEISFAFEQPTNVSYVYVGAHFSENNENFGVNLCDYVTVVINLQTVNRTDRYDTSQTESRTNDCNVEGDAIWYHYNLTLPPIIEFEGTEEEALSEWENVVGTGVGVWVIEITVDSQSVLVDEGEDVDITINFEEFRVSMVIIEEGDNPQVES
jgi:hypothetical protein